MRDCFCRKIRLKLMCVHKVTKCDYSFKSEKQLKAVFSDAILKKALSRLVLLK